MDYENNVEAVETNETVDTVSEETQEVAEPVEEVVTSEETQEVAEPVKSDADAAFAQMRREKQDLEKTNQQLQEALGLYFEGDSDEDLYAQALAYSQKRTPEEVKAEMQAKQEFENLKAENESLKKQATDIKVKQLMADGLKEIQSIDSNVKSLEELGGDFINFIGAGLDAKDAYYALQAKKLRETPVPPKPVGEVAIDGGKKETYTSDEIDNMSKDDIKKNMDAILKSLKRK